MGIIDIYESNMDALADWEHSHQAEQPSIPALIYSCPYCNETFSSKEAWRQHLGLEHPLDSPILEVSGQPLLARSVFRRKLYEADVCVHLATHCRLKKVGMAWETLDQNEVGKRLAELEDSCWVLEIVNERSLDKAKTKSCYEFCIRIPTEKDMNMVDAAFVRNLATNSLSHQAVQTFSEQLPKKTAAREYASALGDYAIAILIKEDVRCLRSPAGFREFAVKMRSSLDVLKHFHRPVPIAVCSSIRFNMNEFKRCRRPPKCDTELGEEFFALISDGDNNITHLSIPNGETSPVCPVDSTTNSLLQAIQQTIQGDTLTNEDLMRLSVSELSEKPISEQDVVKTNVICAWHHLQNGCTKDALKCLRNVRFNNEFGEWAEYNLEKFFPDDK